jgi:hypothetical protein
MARAGAASIPDLDGWLPDPAVRTHHRRAADVAAADLWRCALAIRIEQTRRLGRLVRWRIPGTPGGLAYHDLFRSYPFTVLDEGEHHLVAGLCGRIWTLQRDYPELDGPAAFRGWDEPGTVRVLFAHWVADGGDGRVELCSEARVAPVDRRAGVRLRALWAVIGRFEPLVAKEPLTIAARCAAGAR